jgi:hypothetical protein
LIDFFAAKGSIKGVGAARSDEESVEIGGLGVIAAERAAAFERLFIAELIVRDVGCEDFQVSDD